MIRRGPTDLSSPMSSTGWCALNEILVKPAFACTFCLLTGSLLFATKSNTCAECAPDSNCRRHADPHNCLSYCHIAHHRMACLLQAVKVPVLTLSQKGQV